MEKPHLPIIGSNKIVAKFEFAILELNDSNAMYQSIINHHTFHGTFAKATESFILYNKIWIWKHDKLIDISQKAETETHKTSHFKKKSTSIRKRVYLENSHN